MYLNDDDVLKIHSVRDCNHFGAHTKDYMSLNCSANECTHVFVLWQCTVCVVCVAVQSIHRQHNMFVLTNALTHRLAG